jgi:hypothetical protein
MGLTFNLQIQALNHLLPIGFVSNEGYHFLNGHDILIIIQLYQAHLCFVHARALILLY